MEINIVKIKKVVDNLINYVRQDLIDNVATPTASWLYQEFNGIVLDDTNFYLQLKEILEWGNDDQRRLEVRLMFDKDRANMPTIHIHYPTENVGGGDNTLNTGFLGIEVTSDKNVNLHSRSFVGQYELIVTGANSLQVVMLYEFLDAVLIAGADTLSYEFDKFEFSGKQLLANQDIIPHLTYYRAIGLSLQNKKIVHSFVKKLRAHDIQFEPTYYTDSQPTAALLVSLELASSADSGVEGDLITFTATPTNGGDTPVFEWYVDGNVVPGETSDTIDVTYSTTGTYTVQCKVYSSVQYLAPRPASSSIKTIIIT